MAEFPWRLSKFLCFVLRHHPEDVGIEIDKNGWVPVDMLLYAVKEHGRSIDRGVLSRIVTEDRKGRFSFSEDGTRIRANYGHSLAIQLDLIPLVPPDDLYHGTARRFVESIKRHGLNPGSRQYVHLSPDRDTAYSVGRRHGEAVILTIRAGRLHAVGHKFYRAAWGTWLIEAVPVEYISFPHEA